MASLKIYQQINITTFFSMTNDIGSAKDITNVKIGLMFVLKTLFHRHTFNVGTKWISHKCGIQQMYSFKRKSGYDNLSIELFIIFQINYDQTDPMQEVIGFVLDFVLIVFRIPQPQRKFSFNKRN